MLVRQEETALRLGPGEPFPAEIVNPRGAGRMVLICEHAGRHVPEALGGLGLPEDVFDGHIAWDIGAAGVARRLSAALDAPLVLQPYSRLVVDCNRPFHAVDAIPEISDTIEIPGNTSLSEAARRARFDAIHTPYHAAVKALLDDRQALIPTALVMIHSFTPRLRADGVERPMHLGLLYRRDDRLTRLMLEAARSLRPGLAVSINAPYTCDEDSDFAVPVHGEARGLPYALVEIRNDLIATPEGQEEWAALLAEMLHAATNALQD